MELPDAKTGGSEKNLEFSVVENEKSLETSRVEDDGNAGKDEVVVAGDRKDENEVGESSAVEKSKELEKFVETSMDVRPEEASFKVSSVLTSVQENNGTIKATSSGMKNPKGLPAKKKIVKKVMRLVKKRSLKSTAVLAAGEENATVEQSVEPSFGEGKNEIKKVEESVAESPQCSTGKEKDSETSLGGNDMESKKELVELVKAPTDDNEKVAGAEPSGEETPEEVKGKGNILKSVEKRLLKGKDDGASPGGNVMKVEEAVAGPLEAPKIALSVEKKQPKKPRARPRRNLRKKTQQAILVKTDVDKSTSQLEQNDQENNNSLAENEQHNGVEKSNLLQVDTNEAEEHKPNQLTEDKTGLPEDNRRKRKRRGKQVSGLNKKQRNEVVAVGDVTQQRLEERKEQDVDPENREMDGDGKAKIAGLIFMCNAKTRPDCFRFSVMGVQEKRKDYVIGIKPGMKLFLYDYDLKLLYGVFQASSAGGMKLERNAFGGSFPAQVRFKVVRDCLPLPESQFKKAIKENYNNRNKFKTELTRKQVFKLTKLFQPTTLPAQLNHTLPIPVPRDAERKRSRKDRYAPSSSRTHRSRTQHERSSNAAAHAPSSRREEPPRDLYLSEREYRTYGLRRGETSQHFQIPPTDSSYRDRVPLETYVPSVDHDRLLRQAEIERHDRRVHLLRLPERDYHHPYDHLSSRREVLGQDSVDPPAQVVDRRDPYYRYEYRSPERPPRTYLASSGREDTDLYSRYVTADSLAEYYRSSSSSRRYPSIAESELLPSSVTSRYAYSGSLPYSHR